MAFNNKMIVISRVLSRDKGADQPSQLSRKENLKIYKSFKTLCESSSQTLQKRQDASAILLTISLLGYSLTVQHTE